MEASLSLGNRKTKGIYKGSIGCLVHTNGNEQSRVKVNTAGQCTEVDETALLPDPVM